MLGNSTYHDVFFVMLPKTRRVHSFPDMQAVMRHAVEHYFGGGSELLNMHERLVYGSCL